MIKVVHATDWIVIISLATFTLVGLLRHYFPFRFMAFIKVPINSTYFTEFAQEKEQPFWFGIILETIMLLSISLFIYIVLYDQPEGVKDAKEYIVFIKIFLISALIDMAQHFFHSLTGLLFNMPKSLAMWMHVKDAYLRWASLILVLVSVLAVFSDLSLQFAQIFGLSVLAFIYIIGVAKGSSLLAGNKTLNGLHIFFYLCTLEILPVWVMVKLLA